MDRSSTILRTTADQLMEFIKKKDKVTIEETAAALKVPVKTIQGLVDFLVEEKILGIEYKFTTPYIYLSKKKYSAQEFNEATQKPVLLSKEEFFEKAKVRKIPYQKIGELWNKYLEKQLVKIKEEFYERAKEKKLPKERIDELWQKYLSHL